jgi:hypothetical protein
MKTNKKKEMDKKRKKTRTKKNSKNLTKQHQLKRSSSMMKIIENKVNKVLWKMISLNSLRILNS